MARKNRSFCNSNILHVIIQGINKQYIFSSDQLIQYYLSLLSNYSLKYNINLICYCIMGNHAHLLIQVSNIQYLSQFMKITNQKFAQYYNNINSRVGHVLKNRFLSEPIYDRNYLINCVSYIHNNPVKAHIVSKCSDYKYSSYNDYIYKKNLATSHNIELLFGNTKNYLPYFYTIHNKTFYFLDIDSSQSEIIDMKIKEFKIENSLTFYDILHNSHYLYNLISYIKSSYSPIKLSNIEISKKLNITLEQLKYILKKHK